MNDEELRKARLKSRSEFLQTKSHAKEQASAAVLKDAISDVERGIVPTSLLEMEILQKRAGEVELAAELLRAADARAAMARGETLKPLSSGVGTTVDGAAVEERAASSPLGHQGRDGGALQILPDMATVQAKIASGDVVVTKTEEEISSERAGAVSKMSTAIQEQRKKLPVYLVREEFLRTVKHHQVVVVIGETGSGKTTQLLQYLFEEGYGRDGARLLCTQPRRIAATSVAQRVAQEMGVRCGGLVGYKVRFDDRTSPDVTQIVFLTDGIMLKEMTGSRALEGVSVLMVDEAHERTIASDILLGLLRDVIRSNKSIRVIVASATIEAEKFCKFFSAPKFEIKGRTFRVSTSYSVEPIPDMVLAAATTAMMIHEERPLPGDILVFLPGQEEIESCAQLLRDAAAAKGSLIRELVILPVYSTLPPEEQNKIYSPTPKGTRKVVIATNIAETSITIDGIVYVVDSGLCKQKFYNPETLMEQLSVVPTSQASAEQRRGRAGRTQPGECIRLFTKYSFLNELPKETVPEILRSTLSTVVLNLLCLGIDDLLNFDFLDAPSQEALERSIDHLYLLGAITDKGKPSKVGLQMNEFPLDPALSRCMVKAKLLGCPRAMATAASMLSLENSLFRAVRAKDDRLRLESARDKIFGSAVGDVHGFVRLFQQWLEFGSRGEEFCKSHFINSKSLRRACDVFNQLLKTYEKLGVETTADGAGESSQEALTKCLLSGFFPNVARVGFDGISYHIIRPFGKPPARVNVQPPPLLIHPSSFLARAGETPDETGGVRAKRPELVFFIMLRQTSKPFMQHVTVLQDPQPVLDVAPRGYFSTEDLALSLGRKRGR